MFFDIPRPKKPLTLPKMLNKKEVQKIIEVTRNPKHKLMLKLAYGMGLRVSELVNLKISDIDSTAMTVHTPTENRYRYTLYQRSAWASLREASEIYTHVIDLSKLKKKVRLIFFE